jgi:hypothetical protein
MLASRVHLVEDGYHLSVREGHVYKVHTASGRLIEDFGAIGQRTPGNNPSAQAGTTPIITHEMRTKRAVPPSGNGWVTWAQWGNTNGQPINYFSSTWSVPSAPATNDGQLLYIWNGLEPYLVNSNPNNLVMQPVLQWGANGSGPNTFGGQYWCISNWCAWGANGAYTAPQTVAVGTNLTGVLTLTGQQPDGSYNYTSAFNGYSNTMNVTEGQVYSNLGATTVAIPGIPMEDWAYEVLEVFRVAQRTDYPGETGVTMSNISLQTGPPGVYTPAALQWQPELQTAIATIGESTAIGSSNSNGTGQVTLYFHTPPVITGSTVVNGIASLYSAVPSASGTIVAAPGETVNVVVSTYDKDAGVSSVSVSVLTPGGVTVKAGSNPENVSGYGSSSTLTFVMPTTTNTVNWSASYSQVGGSTRPYDGANIRVY